MENIQVIIAGLTAIILFVFGLENFSAEIQQISGERFRKFLARATNIPLIGLLIGALVTAVIQSSSATSLIAVSLVSVVSQSLSRLLASRSIMIDVAVR